MVVGQPDEIRMENFAFCWTQFVYASMQILALVPTKLFYASVKKV